MFPREFLRLGNAKLPKKIETLNGEKAGIVLALDVITQVS
jgi:hypothetical protein